MSINEHRLHASTTYDDERNEFAREHAVFESRLSAEHPGLLREINAVADDPEQHRYTSWFRQTNGPETQAIYASFQHARQYTDRRDAMLFAQQVVAELSLNVAHTADTATAHGVVYRSNNLLQYDSAVTHAAQGLASFNFEQFVDGLDELRRLRQHAQKGLDGNTSYQASNEFRADHKLVTAALDDYHQHLAERYPAAQQALNEFKQYDHGRMESSFHNDDHFRAVQDSYRRATAALPEHESQLVAEAIAYDLTQPILQHAQQIMHYHYRPSDHAASSVYHADTYDRMIQAAAQDGYTGAHQARQQLADTLQFSNDQEFDHAAIGIRFSNSNLRLSLDSLHALDSWHDTDARHQYQDARIERNERMRHDFARQLADRQVNFTVDADPTSVEYQQQISEFLQGKHTGDREAFVVQTVLRYTRKHNIRNQDSIDELWRDLSHHAR